MRSLFVAALAAAALCTAPATAQDATNRTIAIVTEGEVRVAPDIAMLQAGIVSEGKTAAEAIAQNTPALTRLIDAAKAAGIAPADIRSSQVSLNPRMTQPAPQPGPRPPRAPSIDGYEARTTITVTIRDVARAGPLVDAFVKAGANEMGGLSFGLADESKARDAARTKAAEAARGRAELYARSLGVKLGPVITVVEAEAEQPNRPMGDMRQFRMAAAAPMPVEPGELTVSASLRTVWRIEADTP